MHLQEADAEAEDARVEAAIEGDFDRLIQNIREAGDGSSTGMLTKMWDIDLEEREAEWLPLWSTGIPEYRLEVREDVRRGTGCLQVLEDL